MEKKENRIAFLFILPPIISFTIFTIIPLICAFIIALGDFNTANFNYTFVGFSNFAKLLSMNNSYGKTFLNCVVNTLSFVIEVPIAIFLGLIAATLANAKGCKKTNRVWRLLIYLPAVCSAVASNVIWRVIFMDGGTADSAGVINSLLHIDVRWLHERIPLLTAIIIKNSINSMGSAMILYYASMCNISKDYYEAADLDGANGLQKFTKITFPMLTPVTFYLLIMRLSGCLQSYADSYIFAAGRNEARSVVYFIWFYGLHEYNYSIASAAALLLGVAIMIITIVQFRLSNRWVLDL
ncbi:MAG: sugar ABC transporter permease [Bacilli bacterium]|nr:sugar ABC transporter permease [Bacilli bacterium]